MVFLSRAPTSIPQPALAGQDPSIPQDERIERTGWDGSLRYGRNDRWAGANGRNGPSAKLPDGGRRGEPPTCRGKLDERDGRGQGERIGAGVLCGAMRFV